MAEAVAPGREKAQGAGLTLIWFDEEPPHDIWEECFVRQEVGITLYIGPLPISGEVKDSGPSQNRTAAEMAKYIPCFFDARNNGLWANPRYRAARRSGGRNFAQVIYS